MYASARPKATAVVTKRAAVTLSQAIRSLDVGAATPIRPCVSCSLVQRPGLSSNRKFTTTARSRQAEKDYFPAPQQTDKIRITPPAWHHPIYTEDQMSTIKVAHREAKQWSDWFALATMRVFRFGMDTATGKSHPQANSFAIQSTRWPYLVLLS